MTTYNKDFIVKNGLQVGANTTITGSLTASGLAYPVSDGSANQYLKTDGSGNLSWGTVNVNNITGNLSVSGDITSGGKVLFANVYSALSDLPSASTYHGMFAHVHATGKGYYAHAGNWVELANNSDLYTDAQAVSAVQSATNLTIDGGTIYVDTANDRVGIGDTSPQYMLDVGGTSGTGSIAVAGTEVIDSSAEVITARLKNSGVSAGSYTAADITVDAKGRVTSAASTPIGGSLTGSLANLKLQYGSTYSGTPVQGSFFFDSLNQKLKVYTGSTFVDAVPAGGGGGGGGGSSDANSTFRSYTYTLSSTTNSIQGVDDRTITAGDFVSGHKYTIVSVGTTDFTAIGASANTVGVVFTSTGAGSGTGTASPTLFYDTTSNSTTIVVYVNGVKQVYGSSNDFVATTGTSVAFTYNVTSGSVVDVQVYELLTNAAYYLKSETYSQTQVSNGFLSLTGGTLTGKLTVGDAGNTTVAAIRFNAGLGLSSPSTDQLNFITADTTRMFIDSSGDIFIGTTTDIAPANGTNLYISDSTISRFGLQKTGSNARSFSIGNGGTYLNIYDETANSERFHINSSGYVGIGANPTYTLDVAHKGGLTDVMRLKGVTGNSFIRFEDSDTSSHWSFGVDDGSGAGANALIAYDRINSQYRFVIDNNGNIGIGTVSPSNVSGYRSLHLRGSSGSLIDMGASGKESRIVADDNGLGFQVTPGTHSHQNIRWKAGQISGAVDSHMILLANGNFGIGTTSPGSALHVVGPNETTFDGITTAQFFGESNYNSGDAGAGIIFGGRYNSSNNSTTFAQISGKKLDTANSTYDGVLTFGVRNDEQGVNIERMRITNTGNVGIGTTNPLVNLDMGVTSPNDQVIALRQNGVSRTTLGISSNYGVRIAGPSDASATGHLLEVGQNNASDGTTYQNRRFCVLYNGNVGIGTATPSAQLEISSGAPTFILNANTQASGKKKVRLASSQFTAGDFAIQSMADDGTTVNSTPFKIDTDGYTIPAEFKPDKYQPVLGPSTISGTFISGAAINTWHSITNVNFNGYLGGYNSGYRGVIVAIYWTSGNTTYGYNHNAQVYIPASSSNTHSSYSTGTFSSYNIAGTYSNELPVTVHHHTSVTATHNIRMRLRNSTGNAYDPLRLEIYSNSSPNASNATITVWRA